MNEAKQQGGGTHRLKDPFGKFASYHSAQLRTARICFMESCADLAVQRREPRTGGPIDLTKKGGR